MRRRIWFLKPSLSRTGTFATPATVPARMFAICCGYEDADDSDHRPDPAFKLACGAPAGQGPRSVFPADLAAPGERTASFNSHYDERCFLPNHVYDTDRSKPLADDAHHIPGRRALRPTGGDDMARG